MALSDYEVGAMFVLALDRTPLKGAFDYWKSKSTLIEACEEICDFADLWKYNIVPEINEHNLNRMWFENIFSYAFNKTYRQDSSTVDYWVSKLDNGESRPSILKQLIDDVQTKDQTETSIKYFNNKVEICIFAPKYFDTVPECFSLRFGRVEGDSVLLVNHTEESVERVKDKIRLASRGINPCFNTNGGSSSGGGGSSSGGGGGSTCSSWG